MMQSGSRKIFFEKYKGQICDVERDLEKVDATVNSALLDQLVLTDIVNNYYRELNE